MEILRELRGFSGVSSSSDPVPTKALCQTVPINEAIMDLTKTATELGNKLQSGEEPVSGETGQGTAGEPYDQGNAEGNVGSRPVDRFSICPQLEQGQRTGISKGGIGPSVF